MTSIKHYLLTAFAAAAFSLGLAGCNTAEGVGEDVQDAGEAVEDTARKAKK